MQIRLYSKCGCPCHGGGAVAVCSCGWREDFPIKPNRVSLRASRRTNTWWTKSRVNTSLVMVTNQIYRPREEW